VNGRHTVHADRSVWTEVAAVAPGLDLERAAGHLVEASGGAITPPLSAEVISGGRSNLTYLVRGGAARVVVRRPPLGHVLPSAHDMVREFRVTSALSAAGFPVARPLLLCTDSDVIGAPFYVMAHVDGVVLRSPAGVGPATAHRCGALLVDLLARLHAIDPAAVGLADFGRPDGFLHRQVRRWHRQWEGSRTRELPLLEAVTERLLAGVPESPPPAIVHGDYRLDNVMFTPDMARIAAVMDWEMATLGDPLTDVGLLVVYADLAGAGLIPAAPAGYPSGAELAGRYAAATGRGDRLDWYVAFGTYKLAVIAEGIHARYRQGATVGAGFEAFGAAVPVLVDRAARILGT
jgi:aminoglycoside phosphotransferase (APT) family kinase protein